MYHVLCWFIILFRLLSVIVTFYSEFQTVIIPVTVQNRTSVYMNFFDHKDLGYHLLQLRPKVVKHPVYHVFQNYISISTQFHQFFLHDFWRCNLLMLSKISGSKTDKATGD